MTAKRKAGGLLARVEVAEAQTLDRIRQNMRQALEEKISAMSDGELLAHLARLEEEDPEGTARVRAMSDSDFEAYLRPLEEEAARDFLRGKV